MASPHIVARCEATTTTLPTLSATFTLPTTINITSGAAAPTTQQACPPLEIPPTPAVVPTADARAMTVGLPVLMAALLLASSWGVA